MTTSRVRMTMILAIAMSLGGCAVQSAARYKVKPSLRQECVEHCSTLGMELGAVVLMMDHAGCVCSPKTAQKEIAEAGGATLGGNVTIAAVQAAAAAAQQQQLMQQQRRSWQPTSR